MCIYGVVFTADRTDGTNRAVLMLLHSYVCVCLCVCTPQKLLQKEKKIKLT